MAERYYYLLSALPALGELGTPAPITPGDLSEETAESDAGELVRTILLSDDLLQRDALLAGEIQEAKPAVLSGQQVRDEQPLPEFLFVETDTGASPQVAADAVWAAYYRHADAVGRRQRSEFLAQWVGFEVSLRNALAVSRAKALGIEAGRYLVAPELGQGGEEVNAIVSEWSGAADPLQGLKVLDTARWRWIRANDNWFSFTADELAGYAAKLMLLARHERLEKGGQHRQASASGDRAGTERR